MTGSDSFVEAGWVHDMGLYTYSTKKGVHRFVVVGRVKHSQRMSATPLTPWFAVEQSGEILAARCTLHMYGRVKYCDCISSLKVHRNGLMSFNDWNGFSSHHD